MSSETAPKRAQSIELLGRFSGSGLKDPPYLVRRGDGQIIQLPSLLYHVLEAADGATLEEIAGTVAEKTKISLSGDDLQMLLDEKLQPLGVLSGSGNGPGDGSGDAPALVDGTASAANPLLALKLKTKVVSPRVVRAVTIPFRPLFWPPVAVAALGALGVLDWWLFTQHGVAQSVRATLMSPAVIVLFFALVVASAAFHEIGHATACAYGGAEPGEMGAGLYIAWPVFYTNVTASYALGTRARLRVDLGGIYFNVLFMLGLAGAYFATGFEPLLLLIVLLHFEVAHQFLPFLRLDGYYVLSDLTGVPDMYARIKPILAGLVPGHDTDPRASGLKRWARVVVTVWVLLFVPLVALMLVVMAMHLPRVFATAASSFGGQWHGLTAGIQRGRYLAAAAALISMLALALPLIAMPYTLGRVALRGARAGWRKTGGRPVARVAFCSVGGALAVVAALAWWPNGEYRAISPRERGTLTEAIQSLRGVGAPGGAARYALAHEPPGTTSTSGGDGLAPAPATTAGTPAATPKATATPAASPAGPSPAATSSPQPSPTTTHRTSQPTPATTSSGSPAPESSPTGGSVGR